MEIANISQLTVTKRPGIDDITGSAIINYTGNIEAELTTTIYLADSNGVQIFTDPIAVDTYTYSPSETRDVSGTVITPNIDYGMYNAVCAVQRTDTQEIIAEEMITDAVEIPQRMIYGYVTDELGNPIGGASVWIEEYITVGDTTGPDGYYELKGLPDVSEIVHVSAYALDRVKETKEIGLPGPGEQVRLDFTLISGQVTATITSFTIS